MRLNLWTLLAYLDNNLNEKDAQEISEKIQQSEFAQKLVQRIRDVMRRTRLPAPDLGGKSTLDPNTVAEYLDYITPADQVADFEKVCLESDVELAEVAACHQILALILREAAEVDPAQRQRMYALRQSAAATAAAAVDAPEAAAGESPAAVSEEDRLSLKDLGYLRTEPAVAPKPSAWPKVAVAALVLAVAVVGLAVSGQLGRSGWLAGKLGIEPASQVAMHTDKTKPAETATPAPASTASTVGAVTPSAASTPATSPAAGVGSAPPAAPAVTTTGAAASGSAAASTAKDEGSVPAGAASAAMPPQPAGASAQPTAGATVAVDKPPVAGAPSVEGAKEAAPLPAAAVAMPPATDAAPAATPAVPADAGKPAPAAEPAKMEVAKAEIKPIQPEAAPLPPKRLGRYLSERQILLAFDATAGEWSRLAPQAGLNNGVPLLTPPTFETKVLLPLGATLDMRGGTEIVLQADRQDTPGVQLRYGRLVLRSVGEAKARLRLQAGDHAGVLTFKDPESAIAITVSRLRTPGTDPELSPGPMILELHAVGGELSWEEANAAAVTLLAPNRLVLDGGPGRSPATADPPKWLTGDDVSPLDRRAAPIIEQAVGVDRPAGVALRELSTHRMAEVVWLAVRCLAQIGQFEPALAALTSADPKTRWQEHVDQMQLAIARGPASAAAVREALTGKFGATDGAELYRMLWGYTEAELQGPEGLLLVERLDHEQLPMRMLAYHALERATGAKFTYRPQDPQVKRQPAIVRWKERLQKPPPPPAAKPAP